MDLKERSAILKTLLSSHLRDGFLLQTNILVEEIDTETDGKDQEDVKPGD